LYDPLLKIPSNYKSEGTLREFLVALALRNPYPMDKTHFKIHIKFSIQLEIRLF
jgi:hypothetical protein